MLQLQSNFILAPMKLGYAKGDGKVIQKHIDFYSIRAKNIGAVTYEPLYMDSGLRELPTQLGIDHDDKMEGLRKLNDIVHSMGAKTIAHLNHPGRMANPKIPGNYFWSSTDKPCENGGAIPEQIDREKMDYVINLFVDSAKRAVRAGFDIIEIQFGHGYLLAQFISPAVNDRDDEYGGSFEKRIKFPLEIAKTVRKAVDIPIIARISGDEMIPNGFHIDDMVMFSQLLKTNGINAIHVSAGSVCSTPPWFFQHMFVPKGKTWEFAKEIKNAVNIPTIFVGQINTREDIENLTESFHAKYMAIGRALVADPDFIGKCMNEIKGNIRPCLACAEGCLGGVKHGKGLGCVVNPLVNTSYAKFEKTKTAKHYAVIGGGLAGIEAALTLKRRGHHVDLYEKDKLGGQFNLAPLTPKKKSMGTLVPYFVKELQDNAIKIINKEAVASDILGKYDGAIIATGSKPASIKIPGLDKFWWAEILLKENLPTNKKILIIGGGLIGVDIATALIPLNNQVVIVKRTTDFGEDMEMISKVLSLKMMKEKGTLFSDHTFIKRIDGATVYAERNGEDIQFNDVDLIVVSTGMKSYIPLKNKLENSIPTYIAGDALKIGKAQDAIHTAYELAMKL